MAAPAGLDQPSEEEQEDQRRAIEEAEGSGALEWFLSALFLKSRLLSKLETVPAQERALETYRALVSFAPRISPNVMADELAIAKEMTELLPRKISQM